MSSVKYLAPGVDNTDFHNILMVGISDVGVLTSYKHMILSPPTVSLDLLGSALCGLYAYIYIKIVIFAITSFSPLYSSSSSMLVPGLNFVPDSTMFSRLSFYFSFFVVVGS